MKILVWINGLALLIFGTFSIGLAWVYWSILPQIGSFQSPPSQIGQVIEKSTDPEGLREIARVLYEHLTLQTTEINNIFYIIVFGLFVYGFLVVLLTTANLVLIRRHNKTGKIA